MRAVVMVGVAISLILVLAAPALAHGDERLVEGEFTIGPHQVMSFEGDVHYHRLVAWFDAAGPISLRLVDADAGSEVFTLGMSTSHSINRLITCCDGTAWAPHRLELENHSDDPVVVTGDAKLVHDDLAVSVFGAEPGVIESMTALAAVWTWALFRNRRRAGSSPRAAVKSLAIVSVATVLVAIVGMLRYGVGSAPGLLAGASDLPLFPMNPIVSRASVSVFLGMAGWATAGALWAGARPAMTRIAWSGLGLAVAGAVIVVAALVASTYGTLGVPAFISALALLPIAAVFVADHRRPVSPDPLSFQPQML